MELKQFKDIIAFTVGTATSATDDVIAFHAKNLEVAQISREAFDLMTPITLNKPHIIDSLNNNTSSAGDEILDWQNELNSSLRSGKIEFGIRSITLNVNQICNLKCNYCAAGGDGTFGEPITKISIEKTLPQLKFFLESLKKNSKFYITFLGGEPLLYPEAIKVVHDYVIEESRRLSVNPSMTVVTNGTLFNSENVKLLSELNLNITVSIDGTKEINDLARPTKNGTSSTDLIIKGLKLLSANLGKIKSIGFAAVFTKNNTELVKNYKYFLKLKPDWLEFTYDYAERSPELNQLFIEQMNEVAEIAWKTGGETELRKIKTFDHYFKLLDTQQIVENHCGSGKSYMMVDAKNRLYVCPWEAGDKSAVVGEETTIDYDKIAKYSKSLVELNNCQACWARNLCGGGCMYIHKIHTGDKHIKDTNFCIRTRSLLLTALLYYKLARTLDA